MVEEHVSTLLLSCNLLLPATCRTTVTAASLLDHRKQKNYGPAFKIMCGQAYT